MNYIFLAVLGYVLISVEAVASKFLLSSKVKSWKVYVFYIGTMSLFSFVFAPFGLGWYGWEYFFYAILSGGIFFLYLAFLYSALEHSSASRVYVLSGAVSIIGTFLLAKVFLNEELGFGGVIGVALLLLGGTLISLKVKSFHLFSGSKESIIAGLFLALSLVSLKYIYDQHNFVSGYIYSRLGITLGVFGALAFPWFRKDVFRKGKKRGKGERAKHFLAIIAAKIAAGVGTLMVNRGISEESVTLVNALVSVQYLFTFLFSIFLTLKLKSVFAESLDQRSLVLKSLGVVLVILGVIIVS